MQPRTRAALLAEASRAEAISFIGDVRVRPFADRYIESEAFARPFFAVAYSYPHLSCANVFPSGVLDAGVAYALQNEGSRPPLEPRILTADDRARRASKRGHLDVWQHGHNVTLDPIVVFAVGERDVSEVAELEARPVDAELAARAASFSALLGALVQCDYTNLYVLGIARDGRRNSREREIARSLDERLRRSARDGAAYLEAAEPERVFGALLADRVRRRSEPLDARRRIDPFAGERL